METVFKVGMTVYDQVFYPNQKGTVKRIDDNEPDINFPIEVEFKGVIESYTLKGSRSCVEAPTLSTAPYTLQGFEQKALVPTYEEAVEWVKKNSKNRVVYADEIYINEENEEAFENLKKLVILREYYNEGWQPDWNDNRITKWTIEVSNNNLNVTNEISFSRPLYFKTELLAEKFLEEQRDLLEKAKPLL